MATPGSVGYPPRLGAIKLRDLNPEIIVRFHADLARTGLGDASVRKVLALLQRVLQRAVDWQRIPANPCKAVRKPSQRRDRVVRPLAPEQVEAAAQAPARPRAPP